MTSYKQIDLSNCRAILVPGGDPGSIKDNEDRLGAADATQANRIKDYYRGILG
jgi:hypothetical protein